MRDGPCFPALTTLISDSNNAFGLPFAIPSLNLIPIAPEFRAEP
jgi:hypothetical protein